VKNKHVINRASKKKLHEIKKIASSQKIKSTKIPTCSQVEYDSKKNNTPQSFMCGEKISMSSTKQAKITPL
jgi:hypothetical protein